MLSGFHTVWNRAFPINSNSSLSVLDHCENYHMAGLLLEKNLSRNVFDKFLLDYYVR